MVINKMKSILIHPINGIQIGFGLCVNWIGAPFFLRFPGFRPEHIDINKIYTLSYIRFDVPKQSSSLFYMLF